MFRKKKNEYHLKALPSQNYLFSKESQEILDPIEIILYFELKLRERNIRIEPIYPFLGYIIDKKENDHIKILLEKNLEAFLRKDDIGMPMLYISREDAQNAREILINQGARLTNDYTDPSPNFDVLGGTYYHNLNNSFE